ncbi:5'-nucleotidase, lipoprotein e(P4) family [Fusobacterium mortiferum]|uniref:5'-nucleotidase, lipoprotein e(P4) family n=2 Tax=Fusobacterium TaxID=848 RepID=A0ABS2G4I8_FUSMR|nr:MULTISPECIES: 5'-nucleotidase, lipoprotein e(P4) family [Fusobacterium]MBM6875513.1 5'-nucleotidase, lipoprotein e(P4) family [Fusobacterium mortiferum]MDO5788921.1 5'-nucleotidase, lipoprotein e(P4) family [Fusobacterium sp.]
MKNKKILSLLAVAITAISMTGCSNLYSKSEDKVTLTYDELVARENMMATNWYQTSGEARALYLQGYNVATQRLKEYLKTPHTKPYSIVLDLDETVLDNSPYQAENIILGRGYDSKSWDEWVNMKKAKAVPGAKEFLQFADKNGVKIYYISDRTESQLEATIENLRAEGIPVQANDSVLLKNKDDKSGKVNRREYVKNHTQLIMLFGDNLSDFDLFSSKSIDERNAKVEELSKEFGDRFIIFPNPLYGAFETAIYGGKFPQAKEKLEIKESILKGYKSLETNN